MIHTRTCRESDAGRADNLFVSSHVSNFQHMGILREAQYVSSQPAKGVPRGDNRAGSLGRLWFLVRLV